MSKFRVTFDMDLSHIAPEALEGSDDQAVAMEIVNSTLLTNSRAKIRADLRKVQSDQTLDPEVKAVKMANYLRRMMLTLQAEANLKVEHLADDAVIRTELPFEKKYAAAA